MKSLARIVAATVAMIGALSATVAAPVTESPAPPRPSPSPAVVPLGLTLNDLLHAGAFCPEYAFDPAGQRYAFGYLRSYGGQRSFGRIEPSTYCGMGEVWVHEVKSGSPPRPVFSADHPEQSLVGAASGIDAAKFEGMWVGSFSPRGSRLLLYWKEADQTRAGVYDFVAKRLTVFAFTPDLTLSHRQFPHETWAWLSEDEAVAGVMPEGEEPFMTDMRRGPARRLAAAWEDAWRGDKPSVSVLSSRASGVDPTMQAGKLLRVNVLSGKSQELACGRFMDFRLSPNGRALAALQMGALRGGLPDELTHASMNMFRYEPVLIDLTGAYPPQSLAPGYEAASNSLGWSPDSARVSFFAWPNGESHTRGVYQVFDRVSEETRAFPHVGLTVVLDQPRWKGLPNAAVPFKDGLALAAQSQSDAHAPPLFEDISAERGRVDWFLLRADGTSRNLTAAFQKVGAVAVTTTADALILSADGGVWRVPMKGKAVNLTAGIEGTINAVERRGDWITAQVMGPEQAFVGIHLPDGKAMKFGALKVAPTSAGAQAERATAVGASAAGQFVLHSRSGYRPWQLSLAQANGRLDPVMTINEHFANVRAPVVKTLRYPSPVDGKMLAASVTLPSDWTPDKRYPVILNVYPVGRYATNEDLPSRAHLLYGLFYPGGALDYFNTLGYIVMYPSMPMASLATPDGNPLGNTGKLATAALDALVAQGYADPERVVLFGLSQGSWTGLATIEQTHRFKSAVIAFGMADFLSAYGTWGVMGQWTNDAGVINSGRLQRFESVSFTPSFHGAPWDDPMAYVRGSPVFGVRSIETPVLLIGTDLDSFPMTQFDEMFTALARTRKEAQYLRYWGEGHLLSSPANLRDQWSRMFAWADQWSDVTRDSAGNILYDGERPQSRRGVAPWKPEDFLALRWFFKD